MNAFLALAWNGYREARRNRVTVVVGVFLAVLLLSSTLVTEVTVSTFDRVLTDFGLGTMSLILVFLAIFLSSGLLSREIERRTIFLVVSKPMSRASFLLARVAGNMLTLVILTAAMTIIFAGELKVLGWHVTSVQFVAIAGLIVELFVLTSVGTLLSSFAGTTVSAISVTGLYLIGHLISDIYTLSAKSDSDLVRLGGKTLYYLLPNLDRLNFRPQAAYNLAVSGSDALSAMGYGLFWGALFLGIAIVVFSRRDFK